MARSPVVAILVMRCEKLMPVCRGPSEGGRALNSVNEKGMESAWIRKGTRVAESKEA